MDWEYWFRIFFLIVLLAILKCLADVRNDTHQFVKRYLDRYSHIGTMP